MTYSKYNQYKFQLRGDHFFTLDLDFPNVEFEWASITDNVLFIKNGYAWDGASGPCFNTKNSLTGSLVHDALYQLMRKELLSRSFRKTVDWQFYKILCKEGMNKLRARVWYLCVRVFGKKSAIDTQGRDVILSTE